LEVYILGLRAFNELEIKRTLTHWVLFISTAYLVYMNPLSHPLLGKSRVIATVKWTKFMGVHTPLAI